MKRSNPGESRLNRPPAGLKQTTKRAQLISSIVQDVGNLMTTLSVVEKTSINPLCLIEIITICHDMTHLGLDVVNNDQ